MYAVFFLTFLGLGPGPLELGKLTQFFWIWENTKIHCLKYFMYFYVPENIKLNYTSIPNIVYTRCYVKMQISIIYVG